MLLLSTPQLEGLVDREAIAEAVSRGFAEIAEGRADQPGPTSMSTPADSNRFILMSAVSEASDLAGVKLLADVPDNAGRRLPTQRSMILVVDRVDGSPVALLHGAVPTRVRTAAASAVATRTLSRSDSRTLGLIGAGALAREHALALRDVRPFDRVVVWSRTRERAEGLAADLRDEGWPTTIDVVASPREVLEEADVVCTLTPSVEAIVEGAWLRPGQHLNVVGARPRADEREVDGAAMARSSIWVDDRATARTKSGDLLRAIAEGAISEADVVGTIGEVVAGLARGRRSPGEITLFDSVGIGAQDVAVADVFIRAARAQGLGTTVDLSA
ncbi:ornithine cyclodeaminase family protein [Microbacterium sp. CFBP 13617]|uniref:ornithine cyclodeaminase family protein n=1 Tax=Microbacterium sp. CFBP 13617 TaxID=2774035 RepID=UPI00178775C4|nr:ornithine cyclodeaminase family protein [Microbacterium sp. CFBP 13617]MBD8217686.1 ornithine cyclodeaminase family protein [Microbacterium sp. CFBP 13617]